MLLLLSFSSYLFLTLLLASLLSLRFLLRHSGTSPSTMQCLSRPSSFAFHVFHSFCFVISVIFAVSLFVLVIRLRLSCVSSRTHSGRVAVSSPLLVHCSENLQLGLQACQRQILSSLQQLAARTYRSSGRELAVHEESANLTDRGMLQHQHTALARHRCNSPPTPCRNSDGWCSSTRAVACQRLPRLVATKIALQVHNGHDA